MVAALFANIATFAGYSLSALVVRWYFSQFALLPSPFWLPAGIAFFAAVRQGWRVIPGILLGSLFAEIVVFSTHGWLQPTLISISNTAAPVLAALLLRWRVGDEDPFLSTAGAYSFLGAAAVAHGMLAASGGSLSLFLSSGIPASRIPDIWLRWAVSDGCGTLLIAPVLLMWREYRADWPELRRNRLEWTVCVLVAAVATAYLSIFVINVEGLDADATFILTVPLLWSAVRFPLPFTYALTVVVLAIAVAATLAGHGALPAEARTHMVITFAEVAAGFTAVVLLLGATMNEQRLAKEALSRANLELEHRVDLRTTELRESRRKLEQMAFFDMLTGLGNRRMFEDRFDIMAAMARRKGEQFALAMVDLDRFKEINDQYGHDAGDALLQEAARRLLASVRQSDTVSRLGGDEFGIVLADAKNPAAIDLVCQRIVESFLVPVRYAQTEMRTSASVGVAIFPEHGATMSELYKSADMALYAAKHGGRNTWRWFIADAADAGEHAALADAGSKKAG
jgi:diguanylate cyclase (GGDEF)-like protein